MNWLRNKLDPKYVKICLYAGVTVLITFAACLWLYSSGSLIATFMRLLHAIIQPIILGAIIAYILSPVVGWFDARLKSLGIIKNDALRSSLCVMFTLFLLAVVVVGVIVILILFVTRSVESVNLATLKAMVESLVGDFGAFLDQIKQFVGSLGIDLGGSAASMIGGSAASMISGFVMSITGVATTLAFAIIFCIYFLLDGESVADYFKRLIRAIVGTHHAPDLSLVAQDANRAYSGYIRGQFIDAILVGIETTVLFALFDMPFWSVVGVMMFLANLVPYLSAPTGYTMTVFTCLLDGNYTKMIIGLVLIFLITMIDGNIVLPRLLAANVSIHPLLVVVALLAGGTLAGIAGMFLAVPTAAFIKMEIDRWVEKREASLAEGGSGEED